jgi:hypothetical protein
MDRPASGNVRKNPIGESNMFEETAKPSEPHTGQESEREGGCSSQHRTPVAIEEKAASEQAVTDEAVRARNKAVRSHHQAPEADVLPPFSGHSGAL